MPLTGGACSLRPCSAGYGDAADGAIAIGAVLELTGGHQRLELAKHLLQDPMAKGNPTQTRAGLGGKTTMAALLPAGGLISGSAAELFRPHLKNVRTEVAD